MEIERALHNKNIMAKNISTRQISFKTNLFNRNNDILILNNLTIIIIDMINIRSKTEKEEKLI